MTNTCRILKVAVGTVKKSMPHVLCIWFFRNARHVCDGQEEPFDADGTIVVFHGNAGAAYHRAFYPESLSKQDMGVVLAEYPGYRVEPDDQARVFW